MTPTLAGCRPTGAAPNEAGATVPGQAQGTTTGGKSPPAGCKGTKQNLVLTGALSGMITCAQSARCDNIPANHLGVQITGSFGGTSARLYIRLDPYSGPGTYNTGKVGPGGPAAELLIGRDWQSFLISGEIGEGSAVVNDSGRSGTIDADLLDSNPQAGSGPSGNLHVKGAWACG